MTHILDRLYKTLEERKTASPESSYVARLYAAGVSKCAQKFGEESVETVIEAMKLEAGQNARKEFISESADAIFHLMVLCARLDIKPEDIWSELDSRVGKISDKDLK